MSELTVTRRQFLASSAAGGLSLAFHLPFASEALAQGAGTPEVNAWVVVRPDDTVVVRIARSEMGQGTLTGLAQMVATADVKWMFATGSLDIHVGKPDVVNDTLAHGYDVSTNQNNMRIKALRPAAVHFDPSMHYAVKVNLTA